MSTAADMRFIMEPMLAYAITALVAATLVALGMGFRHRGQIGEVRRKLADSEAIAQAAIERSTQARVQVKQLSQALAEQTRARKILETAQRRRMEAEAALAPAPAPAAEATPSGFASTTPGLPPQGFADTLPMT